MATQKHTFFNSNAVTAPSPPAREQIPSSFETRDRTRTSSSSSLGSSASTIIANGFNVNTTGSDSNLTRIYPSSGSMRQQLLRRLWNKEYRRLDRTGSLSPPLHRSLRSKRTFRILDKNGPDECIECKKLEENCLNQSFPEITMKRAKHNRNSNSSTTSQITQKSYSIETETPNDNLILTTATSNSIATKSSAGIKTSETSTDDMDISNDVNFLDRLNGNLTHEDEMNGNSSSAQSTAENAYFIEMNGDRINITMAVTESTNKILNIDSTSSSLYQELQQQNESINSQLQSDTNNNDDIITNTNASNSNTNNNKNNTNESSNDSVHVNGTYDVYRMENESIALDQNAMDTIISQILVDSLNNIIVVQGKANQNDSNSTQPSSSNHSSSQTQTNDTVIDDNVSNVSSLPLPVTDQIYFPHYLSTETLSEYSTKLSNNSNAIELLPNNLVISVISGSSYPIDGGEMIVHRLSEIPRTESLEVQPSSASSLPGDTHENIQNEQNTEENCDNDDAISLVDSLDEPNMISSSHFDANAMAIDEKSLIEKSQAFFIPIDEHQETKVKNVPDTGDSNQGLEAPIANAMPEKLRERLDKRQIKINERKEAENKRRQEKIQKLIHQHDVRHENKSSSSSSFEILPNKVGKKFPHRPPKLVATKQKNNSKYLRSEIGLLESYTVDAQGNLQFSEPNQKTKANKKSTSSTGPTIVKHVIKKTVTTTKPITSSVKRVNGATSSKTATEKSTNKTFPNDSRSYRGSKEIANKKQNDVEKMTLVHHSPSDMITPDYDCGPRRMYQKTEICEGAKHIEILEIVECINSSPAKFIQCQSTTTTTQFNEKLPAKQLSKIPVPVPLKNKLRNRSILNANQQRTLNAQIRDTVNHHNATININNAKVDKFIADLLIEALNQSTDIGIEFIKTPQNPTNTSQTSLMKLNSGKRMNLNSRRNNGIIIGNNTSGKRSAHNSAKYQQIFDSIPEEKSSSLSIESSNEESSIKESSVLCDNSNRTTSDIEQQKTSIKTLSASSNQLKSTKKLVASGKAAIESDQNQSAEAWFGCFGRTHIENDPIHADEGILKVIHKSSVAV